MKRFLLLTILLATLSGCADIVDWHSRTLFGLDCRPEHLQPDGQCSRVSQAPPGATR